MKHKHFKKMSFFLMIFLGACQSPSSQEGTSDSDGSSHPLSQSKGLESLSDVTYWTYMTYAGRCDYFRINFKKIERIGSHYFITHYPIPGQEYDLKRGEFRPISAVEISRIKKIMIPLLNDSTYKQQSREITFDPIEDDKKDITGFFYADSEYDETRVKGDPRGWDRVDLKFNPNNQTFFTTHPWHAKWYLMQQIQISESELKGD